MWVSNVSALAMHGVIIIYHIIISDEMQNGKLQMRNSNVKGIFAAIFLISQLIYYPPVQLLSLFGVSPVPRFGYDK